MMITVIKHCKIKQSRNYFLKKKFSTVVEYKLKHNKVMGEKITGCSVTKSLIIFKAWKNFIIKIKKIKLLAIFSKEGCSSYMPLKSLFSCIGNKYRLLEIWDWVFFLAQLMRKSLVLQCQVIREDSEKFSNRPRN